MEWKTRYTPWGNEYILKAGMFNIWLQRRGSDNWYIFSDIFIGLDTYIEECSDQQAKQFAINIVTQRLQALIDELRKTL